MIVERRNPLFCTAMFANKCMMQGQSEHKDSQGAGFCTTSSKDWALLHTHTHTHFFYVFVSVKCERKHFYPRISMQGSKGCARIKKIFSSAKFAPNFSRRYILTSCIDVAKWVRLWAIICKTFCFIRVKETWRRCLKDNHRLPPSLFKAKQLISFFKWWHLCLLAKTYNANMSIMASLPLTTHT